MLVDSTFTQSQCLCGGGGSIRTNIVRRKHGFVALHNVFLLSLCRGLSIFAASALPFLWSTNNSQHTHTHTQTFILYISNEFVCRIKRKGRVCVQFFCCKPYTIPTHQPMFRFTRYDTTAIAIIIESIEGMYR